VLSQFTPLIGDTSRGFQEDRLDKDLAGYNRLESAAAQEHMRSMPTTEPGPYGTPVPASNKTKLAWAQRGQSIPSLKNVMDQYIADQVVKEPEREEARAERATAREETVAEARRRQADELRYRRERDEQAQQLRRDLAAQAAADRAALKAMGGGGGGGGGGDKASDYQIVTASDGTVYRVGKKPGSPMERVEGASGRQSATTEKTAADAVTKQRNAAEGLVLLRDMEPLLSTATSSGAGALRDTIAAAAGYSTSAGDAAGELLNMGANLVSLIDRSGLGPQFSDADLKFLSNKAGGLGDPTVPESRKRAVYNRVVQQFKRAAGAPSREASGSVAPAPAAPRSSTSGDPLVDKYLNR
jgi:hypothetical protein